MSIRFQFQQFLSKYRLLLGVLLLGLLLRLPLLNSSLWMDEAAQALESVRPWQQQFDLAKDFQPPLLHLLLKTVSLVGTSEWWLRTWGALIPGLISIWGTYLLGKRLKSQKVGLLASLLLATSSFHLFYSQELRPYALPTMWAVLSWLMLQTIQHRRSDQDYAQIPFLKNKVINLNVLPYVGYTIFTIAGIYSSFLYPFLVLAQLIYVLTRLRKYISGIISTWLISAICFLPWLPMFFQQLSVGRSWQSIMPAWSAVVGVPQWKSLPLVMGKFVFGVIDLKLSVPIVTSTILLTSLFILTVIPLLSHWWQQKKGIKISFWLPLIWFVVPILSAWLVSWVIPVLQPKRVLFALPGLYLSLALLIDNELIPAVEPWWKQLMKEGVQNFLVRWLWRIYSRVSAWLVIALVLLINLISCQRYFALPLYQRENWKQLHQQIVDRYPAGQAVAAFIFDEPFAPWRWYDDGNYPTWVMGSLNVNQVDDLPNKVKQLTEYRYVIVFDYLQDLTDQNRLVIKELQAFDYQQIELLNQENIGFVRVFARPNSTLSDNKL